MYSTHCSPLYSVHTGTDWTHWALLSLKQKQKIGGKEGDGLLEGEAPTYIQHHQVWWGRVSQASTCIQCDKKFYPVRETMGLKQFSVEDIDTVLGILLVNDFEINSKVRKSFQK